MNLNWSSQSDWDNAQESNNIGIVNNVIRLAEIPFPNLVDNYEDDPDGPYASGEDITDYYTGDTGAYSRSTATSIDGSYSLQASHSEGGSSSYRRIVSLSGLPNYPSLGDNFSVFFRSSNLNSGQNADTVDFDFFEQSDGSGIRIQVEGSGDFALSSPNDVSTGSHSLSDNTWYEFYLETQTDGTIDGYIRSTGGTNLHSLTITDNTFTSGGIAFQLGNNQFSSSHTVYWDNASIL